MKLSTWVVKTMFITIPIYGNPSATINGDGQSCSTPYNNMQSALDYVTRNSCRYQILAGDNNCPEPYLFIRHNITNIEQYYLIPGIIG